MKLLFVWSLSILLFFKLTAQPANSAEITFLETGNTNLDQNSPLSVFTKLSINADDGTIYYLRGVFNKRSDNNYCGFTHNGSDWFSGPYSSNEGWKKFLKVNVINNEWSGTVSAKIDPTDAGCIESGVYEFRIQRFNEQSGSSTFDTQTPLVVSVVIPTVTATPTVKPSKTPTPSKNTVAPTKVENSELKSFNQNESEGDILPARIENRQESTSKSSDIRIADTMEKATKDNSENSQTKENTTEKKSKVPLLLVVTGLAILIVSCGILLKKSVQNTYD